MSQVEERRGAECVITLEDAATGEVLSRYEQAIDLQPRDLWLWQGDPRSADHRTARMLSTPLGRVAARVIRSTQPPGGRARRPRGRRTGSGRAHRDASFWRFNSTTSAAAEERVEATVSAIYAALQARSIAYSEPPPGWDYTSEGQRIRDHGDVARGGLGTCMDTTVLTAAVLEQVGLFPVLVLHPGHIFVGYWRRNPFPDRGAKPRVVPGHSRRLRPSHAIHVTSSRADGSA